MQRYLWRTCIELRCFHFYKNVLEFRFWFVCYDIKTATSVFEYQSVLASLAACRGEKQNTRSNVRKPWWPPNWQYTCIYIYIYIYTHTHTLPCYINVDKKRLEKTKPRGHEVQHVQSRCFRHVQTRCSRSTRARAQAHLQTVRRTSENCHTNFKKRGSGDRLIPV
jgi:hypothetical protein